MFPSNCKAVLRALDGAIIEYGQVNVSLNEKYAEFSSQFVPLLNIDTEAKIVCLEDTTETHVITGKVYLSSKNLLRIVDIKCSLMPGAENALEIPTYLNAKIYKPIVKTGLFSKKKIIHKWDNCVVISLSLDKISIRASRIMCEYEDHLKMSLGLPVFSIDTQLELKLAQNGLMFGKNSRYTYSITKISDKAKAELAEFIKHGSLELIQYLQ
jgi:hypothetical protein